ncbi:UDP-N-acetylmuramoyl-L-alanyl-D-glutamate--2,6-diaminopimelate ligase [Candidatus Odyssella thessalonicensis]|uniref:UDP-N-acetylmuramoyl-L-alanyl-D-glutamate--2, 6-diaminopimelate ligase n=1 Tax=Candidatus Odyssella thessalonicensis TaxID=84647 RepID=UPI000225BF88|nr:UDP-N-acetylmuramoyl-L-alanyl-D-glutamate--2,6-diaminopimelate ligase [Candidatus Odyssella thessalonicensis]
MKINDILPHVSNNSTGLLDFKTITNDSRVITAGDVFFAIPCDTVVEHIRSSIKKGAVAIVLDASIHDQIAKDYPSQVFLPVKNVREAFSTAASHLYPHQPTCIYAVTGTNGKSSVMTFVHQILAQLGRRTASFGTIGLEVSADAQVAPFIAMPKLTTPDALSMHKLLHQLTQQSITDFIFEASSHGLDQYRLHQVRVKSAGFTNLTQDHLDYHSNMEAYFNAKVRLFTEVLEVEGTATVNVGCPYGKSLALMLRQKGISVITYAVGTTADLAASKIHLESGRIKFNIAYGEKDYGQHEIAIAGIFQVENILCALGMVMGMGYPLEDVLKTLPYIKSARGRMELVGLKSGAAAVYVDYAHTPDALMRALQALRLHVKDGHKLHMVFGCGGNRDALKRPLMGKIANDFADVIIVTDDNPRFEDPSFIRAQILANCSRGQDVGDRVKAIEQAIAQLSPGDILLIAGKGHETGQIIKDEVIPFDDVQVAASALQKYEAANKLSTLSVKR